MTLKYGNVDIDKLTGKIYKDRLLINYETNNFMIQTDWFKLTHYGIPKSDKYHTTEESRRYFQIPLNDNDFKMFINNLDKHFSSDNFRNKYLNEKQRSFSYIPILKEGKNNYPPSMKFKINVYEDKISSEILHKTNDGIIKCDLENMEDFKKCIPYMSEYKLIFKINKIWFMSKKYGVQIKFIKALVKVKDKEESNVEFIA